MVDHWEFAMSQTNAGFVSFQRDKSYMWADLFDRGFQEMIARDSETVTFGFDEAMEFPGAGLRILDTHSESRTFIEIPSRDMLAAFAEGRFPAAAPRPVFSIVRRSLIERMRRLNGRVCDASAPDVFFACLAMTQVNSVLHFDAKAYTNYSHEDGNGYAEMRGVPNAAFVDFSTKGTSAAYNDSPYPDLKCIPNNILNCYQAVMKAVGPDKMPAPNWEVLRHRFVRSIEIMGEGPFKQEQWRKLQKYGLTDKEIPGPARKRWKHVVMDVLCRVYEVAPGFSALAERVGGGIAQMLGLKLPISPRRFSSLEEALAYRRTYQPRIAAYRPHILARLDE